MRRIRMHWSCLGVCLLLASCGTTDDTSTRARNLATGEIQTFTGEVPEGFVPCTDPTCAIPPQVPCEKLGTTVCQLHPDCRLKELFCQGEGCACPACAPGATCAPCTCPPPKPPVCEYTCIPKLPLLCDELTEKDCLARKDCEWEPVACMLGCPSPGPCPPCVGGICQSKPVPPPPSGCKSNVDCGKSQFCLFKAGCGQLGPGTCTALPQACPMYYSPVCGCDGKTYGNDCEAHGAGTSVAHAGACNLPPPPPPAGCTSNAGCKADQLCFFKAGCGKAGPGTCINKPQACPMYYSPVCGCDGKTYGNECEALGAGTSVAAPGACNVKPDPAVCAALEQKYIATLQTAKACNPAAMTLVMQCAFSMPTDLACHICNTFVNDATGLKAIESDYAANGCSQLVKACPAMACQAPVGATCDPVAGTTQKGVCKDVLK